MVSESKKREVLQLLKDYRTFMTAFGGARPLDETRVAEASYGPAGLVLSGQEYTPKQRKDLAESYKLLDYALKMLKAEDFRAWMSLVTPYLGDPADPSLVTEHRRKADEGLFSARLFLERHERAIRLLAMFLEDRDLFVIFPKRMTSREEKQVERRNEEFYGLYRRLREDSMKRGAAIKTVAEMQSYGLTRANEIVNLRESQPR